MFQAQTASPYLSAFFLRMTWYHDPMKGYRVVIVTDQRILLCYTVLFRPALIRAIERELPRSTRIGPPHGYWWRCDGLGPRLYVDRQPSPVRRAGTVESGGVAVPRRGYPRYRPGVEDDGVTGAAGETDRSRAALLAEAADRAGRYLRGLADRAVAPSAEALLRLDELDFPLPQAGLPPARVLAALDEAGSAATMASAGPRYFGFVTGGALPIAVAASWLLAAWDQNAALSVMSPAATRLDAVALSWVCELLGLPAGTAGGFVSGATMANATCLAAARDAVLTRAGWDASGAGLVGAPAVQVVAGDEVHAAVLKALGLIGLGRGRAVRLRTDDQGRIALGDLPELDGPAIVCLQAGNVNSGASDPFGPLIDWAHEQGAWVHVDGAFGLWAAACPELAGEVAGVAAADSWATDAHKWLNTTYDCGIALVRDGAALRAAMGSEASYLPAGAGRNPMQFTPGSSQRARGAEVWAVLAALGRDGLCDLLAGHVALARRFAAALGAGGLDVLNEVRLNQVVVACDDARATDEMIAAVQREGTCWCGPTTWRGRRAMRVSISNWATTQADVDRSIAAVLAAAPRGSRPSEP